MDTRVAKREWSLSMRVNHWLMALSIFILIPTGFYIADPFSVGAGETFNKFLMGHIRYIHIFFGIVLVFLLVWRVYMMFFSRFHADYKDFLAWTDWPNFWKQIKFYAFISEEKPGHKYLYGPLQSLAYGGLIVMWLIIVITGLALMGNNYSVGFTSIFKPLAVWMGGLATVRYVHHIFTWLFILFIPVHLYMAFWYDAVIKEGTLSSMVGGRLFKKNDH
jgi:Ni/Fe-hydrogenase 1 B-type cytochrome subunit